jgi:hypothetical protein
VSIVINADRIVNIPVKVFALDLHVSHAISDLPLPHLTVGFFLSRTHGGSYSSIRLNERVLRKKEDMGGRRKKKCWQKRRKGRKEREKKLMVGEGSIFFSGAKLSGAQTT